MVKTPDHDFGTFFLQFFFEPCVCIFYALSPTIILVIFFTTFFCHFLAKFLAIFLAKFLVSWTHIKNFKTHLKKVRYAKVRRFCDV